MEHRGGISIGKEFHFRSLNRYKLREITRKPGVEADRGNVSRGLAS
jgi:hypothetical protein